mmetsp:Transcript_10637/g.26020  ORF Transcript_10637/g.26020 Transcript_10637/m.26020 type:complete len:254 (-) Transcript_10637:340-1101(-)
MTSFSSLVSSSCRFEYASRQRFTSTTHCCSRVSVSRPRIRCSRAKLSSKFFSYAASFSSRSSVVAFRLARISLRRCRTPAAASSISTVRSSRSLWMPASTSAFLARISRKDASISWLRSSSVSSHSCTASAFVAIQSAAKSLSSLCRRAKVTSISSRISANWRSTSSRRSLYSLASHSRFFFRSRNASFIDSICTMSPFVRSSSRSLRPLWYFRSCRTCCLSSTGWRSRGSVCPFSVPPPGWRDDDEVVCPRV